MTGQYYTKQDRINDLKDMIEADREHLMRALEDGSYRTANRFLKAIMDNDEELRALIG